MSDNVVRKWEALVVAVYAECARHGLILDEQDPPIDLCLCDGTEDPIEVAREIMWWETTDELASEAEDAVINT